jgi:hypothetical protein
MNAPEYRLKKNIQELDRIALHDFPIDTPIKKVVALMNLLGFPTFFSCGGHCGKKRMVIPYVMGQANGKPSYRFIGERKLIDKIVKKHGVHFDDVRHLGRIQTKYDKEFWSEVIRLHMRETKQYKFWIRKNKALAGKLDCLVKIFNKTRKSISQESRLCIDTFNEFYRLQFQGEEKWYNALTKKGYGYSDRLIYIKRLSILRREIQVFDKFLEEKFFRYNVKH